jgi:hypothetical protein
VLADFFVRYFRDKAAKAIDMLYRGGTDMTGEHPNDDPSIPTASSSRSASIED